VSLVLYEAPNLAQRLRHGISLMLFNTDL